MLRSREGLDETSRRVGAAPGSPRPDDMTPEHIESLVAEQRLQREALQQAAGALAAMAEYMGSLVARALKVVLVYPWASNPSVFRAVLVQSAQEETRLADALRRFAEKDVKLPIEDWLIAQDFRVVDVGRMTVGETRDDTRSRRSAAPARAVAKDVPDVGELKLELESPEPRAEG